MKTSPEKGKPYVHILRCTQGPMKQKRKDSTMNISH